MKRSSQEEITRQLAIIAEKLDETNQKLEKIEDEIKNFSYV